VAQFRIQLFGTLQIFRESQPIGGIATNRLQSLLAYLILHDSPQSRESLAFQLWPESSEPQARTNLRQLLHHLRRALPGECDYLIADNHTVEWRRDSACACDFLEFDAAMARGAEAARRGDPAVQIEELEQAAQIYQDELVRGIYDEWLRPIREQYARQLTDALATLAALHAERRNFAAAIRHADRLVALDPLSESHHQLLIRLHAENQDRASAMRAYHQCMRTLRRELAVDPGPETRALFDKLLKAEPIGPARTEAPTVDATPRAPMIGRKPELVRLSEWWRTSANGGIRMAAILGEPGIGKSRLAEELYEWCARHGGTVARARCYSAQGQLAYAPVAEWLRAGPLREACTMLSQQQLGELARVLPELLASHPGLGRPGPLTESWERHHFYESLTAVFDRARKPLLLWIDDLQWCDQDSFDWLHSLFRSPGAAQTLVLATVRPEETGRTHPFTRLLADLRQRGQVLEVSLATLDSAETAALAAQVAGGKLDAARLDNLYRDTKGNPLFVVESLRAESQGVEAPARIHSVIAARLAQLSATAYELAGLAGAIGQSFSFDLLAKATDWDEESVSRALEELWQRRIIEGHGESNYDFTHDRLREVAYAELNPVRQRFLHRRIARALEELRAASAQIAAHFEAAGIPEPAIEHYRAAAGIAHQRFAFAEAAGLLRRALVLCEGLPETGRRDELELGLQLDLGNALVTTEGYATAEVGAAYTRALVLAQRLGVRQETFAILHGLWVFHIVRAEVQTSFDFSRQCLAMIRDDDPPAVAMAGLFTTGASLFHLGRFRDAENYMLRSLELRPRAGAPTARLFGTPDVGVFCRSYLSHVQWHLGAIGDAAASSVEALAEGRAAANPFTRVICLNYAAMLHAYRRETGAALALARESVEFCKLHGFAYYLSMAEILGGWARTFEGDPEGGVAEIRQGLVALKATGAELRLPFYHGLLAEAASANGNTGEAMAHIANSFAFQSKNAELWTLGDLHRIHGDVLRRSGDAAAADAAYRKCIEAARQCGALAVELRAAVRLGDRAEVTRLCAFFADDLDSPDLRAARAFLHREGGNCATAE
jgi:DNA-binding SARP family transcriptional activator/predicted ATPase